MNFVFAKQTVNDWSISLKQYKLCRTTTHAHHAIDAANATRTCRVVRAKDAHQYWRGRWGRYWSQ